MSLNCEDYIKYILEYNTVSRNLEIPQEVIAFSGQYANDFGLYEQCKSQSSKLKYSIAKVQTNTSSTFYHGMCLPSECILENVQNSQAYGTLLGKLTEKYSLKPESLKSFSVEDGVKGPSLLDGWFFVAGIIWVFLMILVIIGTCMSYRKKSWKKRQSCTGEDPMAPKQTQIEAQLINENSESVLKESKGSKFLLCFSFWRNFFNVFLGRENQCFSMNFIQGLQFVSLIWLLYASTYKSYESYINNFTNKYAVDTQTFGLILYQRIYASDLFLFTSAYMFSWNILQFIKTHPTPPNAKLYFQLYLRKFLNIMPIFQLILLFYWRISVFMERGPIWSSYQENVVNTCDQNMWKNFLFLDNILTSNGSSYCYQWGWIFTLDVQLSLLVPLLIIAFVKSKKIYGVSMLLLFLIPIAFNFLYFDQKNTNFNLKYLLQGDVNSELYISYYTNPLMRINATIFGVWTAVQLFKVRAGDSAFLASLLDKKLAIRRICYLLSLFLLFHVFVLPKKTILDQQHWANSIKFLYVLGARYIFLFLCLFFILPSCIDPTVFLCRFFSSKFLLPFARIGPIIYMIGAFRIDMAAHSIRQSITWSLEHVATLFLYGFLQTLLTATEVHFLVEGSLLNVMETYLNINWNKKENVSELPIAETDTK